jgi:hypothetical protein
MAILKANIETFLNTCLEDDVTAADLAEAIKLCLRDISNMGLLWKLDNTKSLSDESTFIELPAEYKDILSIVLVDAASLGAITAFATSDAGAKTQVTSTAHGLSDGDIITLTGTINYDGSYVVEQKATNTFVIPIAYVADDATGMWMLNSAETEDPLIAFSGGWREYLENTAESTSIGTPEQYVEHNGKIYLYPPSDGDYGVLLEYQKYDTQDPDVIEFGDEFSNCIKYGTLFFYAMMKGRERYVNLWGQKYEVEKEFRRINMKHQPFITR